MNIPFRNRARAAGALAAVVASALLVGGTAGQAANRAASVFALNSESEVEARGVVVEKSVHKGRAGLRVVEADEAQGYSIAIIKGTQLLDGSIEIELAGAPRSGSPEGSRGFVGVAFRVQPEASSFEAFYLRPTNGRADDQIRRNHTTQYISEPGYPWHKLRAENPGVYESYVDTMPAEWTKLRIEVEGRRARLFVNGAAQPCLIVNDLKQEPRAGAIALWIGQGTEAFFRNLKVTPK